MIRMALAYILVCGWTALAVVLQYLFCWIKCVWCGQWFPFWGRPQWGPRKPWQCKSCGRTM